MPTGDSKTCTKCGETKPLSEFSPRNDRPGGVRPNCKPCCVLMVQEYRRKNPERAAAVASKTNKVAYAKRRDELIARSRANYHANPQRAMETQRKWAERNREKVNEAKRRYSIAHPEVGRNSVRRRRARKRANGFEKYCEKDIYARDGGVCQYCHIELPLEPRSGWHLDHIVPISKGGPDTPDNVCLACPSCNRRKAARTKP